MTHACRYCGTSLARPHRRLCSMCLYSSGLGMMAANKAIAKARRAGALPSPKSKLCVDCGAPAHDYDHRDYAQPLKVEPVCRSCNIRRGPAKPRVPFARAAA